MNFVQLFKQLDEILYEVMSWIIFFPVTLWRALTGPLAIMRQAGVELTDSSEGEERYSDVLSPPLFLLLCVLLAHGVELTLVGQSEMVASRRGLSALISNDTNLIIFRLISFAAFPLALSATLIAAKRVRLERDALRWPFYAQCYPAGVFALASSLCATLMHENLIEVKLEALAALLAALLWYLIVETIWFRRQLQAGWLRALALALGGSVAATVAVIGLARLFA